MELHVTMTVPEWDSEEPAPLIIREAARQLVASFGTDLKAKALEHAEEALATSISEQIVSIVREACEAAVQPSDEFGHPIGEKTSLRAVLSERARKALTEPEKSGGYYEDRTKTLLRKTIDAAAREAIEKDLADVLKKAREDLKAQVTKAVADEVTGAALRALKL